MFTPMDTTSHDIMRSPADKQREDKVVEKTSLILRKYGSLAKFLETLEKKNNTDQAPDAQRIDDVQ